MLIRDLACSSKNVQHSFTEIKFFLYSQIEGSTFRNIHLISVIFQSYVRNTWH